MNWLTEDAKLICAHVLGNVDIKPTQSFVTIEGRLVLVETDPEERGIDGCPNVGPTIKPCTKTRRVEEGYSPFITIEGRRVCLDTVKGKTNGTPPGTVYYFVREP